MSDNAPPDGREPGTGNRTAPASGRPPTFTSWLRGRSDDALVALLRARPDLAQPVPADIGALASRATTRNTVLRVLERLDRFTLQVLESVVALGDDRLSEPVGVSAAELAEALGPVGGHAADRADATADTPDGAAVGGPATGAADARTGAPAHGTVGGPVGEALDTLLRLALVWPDRGRLRPVQVLRDLLPQPAQLGPPARVLLAALPHAAVRRLADDLAPGGGGDTPVEAVAAVLSAPPGPVGDQARRLLDSMAWGPPHGTVSDARREVTLDTAASPVEELIARALLLPSGDDTLTLPREVGLHLRSGRLFREVTTAPPPFEGTAHSAEAVARAAAGQAFTVLRAVEELLEHWSEDPAAVLRNGGLGVRDLRRAAQTMDTDEATAALFVEIAYASGLLGADDRVEGEWLPTREYDLWRERAPAHRWLRLASAWLESDRVASLSGSRDSGGRMRNALGPGLVRPAAPQARRDLLTELGTAEPGLAPLPDSLSARLSWRRPRRQSPVYAELVRTAAAEAAALGLTGRGALADHVRPLLEGDEDAAARVLGGELPKPLDYVLVQGDLTAVAPGPLVAELARELALVADVESTGGATVYRFTEGSVRRALDAGRGVADITALLERHSRTPLPQALRYLVSDVGRRHGRLRAGSASSYLRCDEPALLEELVSDRRADDLGLLRLAPTVVASRLTRAALVERLRQLGYHPVPEGGDGSMRLSRPEVRRADAADAPPPATDGSAVSRALAAAAVRAVRAGDEAATAARTPVPLPENGPPGSRSAAVLEVLAGAARDGRRVWIGYTDTDGRQVSRIVEPSGVDGGFLTAYDATRAAVHRFAVHRVTAVAELDPEPGEEAGRQERVEPR
ncbi:helicase-associated domain-containing protein [Nocardiopsis dassonvillei]|uniref:helicase-associated domain-containing protein n=3 Tax=Nocardiopsis dassonvillei TaxID=2014 RepID=UPI000B9D6CD2|nr:helicase-associated domain-containing protein [Nocardiopsis dassonvillei]ASU60524.1 helicase [Nocardiopsis dassonvillei]